MRSSQIKSLGVFILLAVTTSAGARASAPQLFVTSCAVDDEITANDRAAVNEKALSFVRDVIGPDLSIAYAAFTAEAKGNLPIEQFVSGVQNAIKPMAPFNDLRVAHTYMAKVTGGSQEQRAVCGRLSSPEGWVAVTVRPGPPEAHVVVEAQTVNNSAAFLVWLIPEAGSWHVQYLHFVFTAMVGKTAGDMQKLAEAEQAKQHNFNAFILYNAAQQLAYRGPFFQLGISPDIDKAVASVQRPPVLQGQAPFLWNFDNSHYKLLNVGPIGVGGKIYLLVDHEVEPWANDQEVISENRGLISAFAKAYPEYKEAFSGIVIRAHERGGNRAYGTVDENSK